MCLLPITQVGSEHDTIAKAGLELLLILSHLLSAVSQVYVPTSGSVWYWGSNPGLWVPGKNSTNYIPTPLGQGHPQIKPMPSSAEPWWISVGGSKNKKPHLLTVPPVKIYFKLCVFLSMCGYVPVNSGVSEARRGKEKPCSWSYPGSKKPCPRACAGIWSSVKSRKCF